MHSPSAARHRCRLVAASRSGRWERLADRQVVRAYRGYVTQSDGRAWPAAAKWHRRAVARTPVDKTSWLVVTFKRKRASA